VDLIPHAEHRGRPVPDGTGGAVTSWFATRELERGVYLVSEPVHVNSFLIEGNAAAALIDTGLGIGNVREVADATPAACRFRPRQLGLPAIHRDPRPA